MDERLDLDFGDNRVFQRKSIISFEFNIYHMKYLLTILLLFMFSPVHNQEWQPIEQANWELFNKLDHKKHMVVGQLSTIYPSLFIAYKDEDNPNIKKGLLIGASSSIALTVGKEVIWDYYLGYGTATYPDLVYGITGTLVGVAFTYLIYKFDRWYVKNYERTGL